MAGSAKGVRAGKAFVEVYADNNALSRGLKAAEAKVKAFGKSVSAIGAGLSGAGAAITAPFLGAAKSFSDVGTELKDVSDRTGLTVENLSALSYAAAQTETDIGTLENGLRKMARTLVKGSEDNLQAEATFAALGLSVDKLMRMSPDQQFEQIAKAIAAIPNPTAKAAAAMEIFGKSGTQLLPMIADMDSLIATAGDLGLVMSAEDAAAAHALGDAMTDINAVLSRTAQIVGATLAPVLTDTAKTITRLAKTVFDWVDANRELLATAFKVGAAIAAVGVAVTAAGVAIYGLGAALGVAAAGFGGIVAALGAILSPIGLIVAGLAGLAAWFVTSTKVGQESLAWLGERFGELLADAKDAFGGIADALKSGDIALAGQILWAALKVEWLKGTNYLKSVWADWSTATIEVFRGASFTIAKLLINAWAGIKTAFANTLSFLRKGWGSLQTWFAKMFVDLGAGFEAAWAKISGFFTGEDLTRQLKDIENRAKAAKGILDKDNATNAAGIEKTRADKVKGIESDRAAQAAALKDQQQAEVDARRAAAQAGLAGDAKALAQAQLELDALLKQAKAGADAASDSGGTPEAPKLPDLGGLTPDTLDAAVQQTKAKVDTAGGFSAAALAGMGAGATIADKQLNEQQKTNDKLDKLNRTVKTKQAAFV